MVLSLYVLQNNHLSLTKQFIKYESVNITQTDTYILRLTSICGLSVNKTRTKTTCVWHAFLIKDL